MSHIKIGFVTLYFIFQDNYHFSEQSSIFFFKHCPKQLLVLSPSQIQPERAKICGDSIENEQ